MTATDTPRDHSPMRSPSHKPTLAERIAECGITAGVRWDDSVKRPDDLDPDSNAYRVTLHYTTGDARRRMTVPFFTGSAWTRDPNAHDVLESLLSDASSADQSFEDWCGDYGYDTDSRKAERMYRAVVAQTAKLRRFLGEHFDAFMWETEQ